MKMASAAGRSGTCLLLLIAFASSASAESWCDEPPTPAIAALKPADIKDDWFKVYAVAPGVFAITEPRQYEGVNSFLVVGSERAVLFDSGMGPPFGCNLRSLTSGKYRRGVLRGPDFESDGSNRRASCRVRLAWLRPNKRIRWALYSPPFLGHDEDFAPRPGGWYETAA